MPLITYCHRPQRLLIALISLFFVSVLNGQSTDKFLKKMPQPTGTLYFIKPLKWKEKGGNRQMETDFTFKFENVVDTVLVTLNASIFSKNEADRIESFYVKRLSGEALPVETLYVQQKKGKWESRIQTTFPLQAFLDWLPIAKNEILEVSTGSSKFRFQSSKKWEKAIEALLPVLEIDIEKGR